jgi:hypothetical protein
LRWSRELIITWDKLFIAPMIHFSLPVDNGRSHWHKAPPPFLPAIPNVKTERREEKR